jgi:hypothetical protein
VSSLLKRAAPVGGLPLEAVVWWPVRGDGPTHREGRPRCPRHHVDELLERPSPEATSATAGRRHVLPVQVPPDVLEQEANHDEQQPSRWVLRRGRDRCLLREAVGRFDPEALAIVRSSLTWRLNERRVSGVAVTRHAVFVVATVSVGAVDVDREFDGPLVTVEFRRDVVFDDTTPALAKFRCDLLPPFDDRRDVGEVVGVQQCETLTVVELGIEVDGLDLRVKAFEHAEELGEDTAGGVTVFETAHRQRVAFVSHPRVEGSIGVEGGSAVFGFGVVEAVCLVFIAVVGPQVEVSDDLHLLGEVFDDISLKQEIANGSDGVEVELGAEVMKNVGAGGSIVAVLAEFGDRGPVGA